MGHQSGPRGGAAFRTRSVIMIVVTVSTTFAFTLISHHAIAVRIAYGARDANTKINTMETCEENYAREALELAGLTYLLENQCTAPVSYPNTLDPAICFRCETEGTNVVIELVPTTPPSPPGYRYNYESLGSCGPRRLGFCRIINGQPRCELNMTTTGDCFDFIPVEVQQAP